MYFDIGSNIGKWSLSNIESCDKIISVEASPITFGRLVEHCKHDRIVLLNYAVCDNSGKDIAFYQAECDTLSTINKDWLSDDTSRFYNYPYSVITCKTIGIDTLIEQYGLPDLIKIDVEGGEFECIRSLTQKVNLLCFEWASETNMITFNCMDYLFGLGFTQYYIQREDNYLFRPQDNAFYGIQTAKTKLLGTVSKVDWGMIWCK
jgi:FkbM family methyltransferase